MPSTSSRPAEGVRSLRFALGRAASTLGDAHLPSPWALKVAPPPSPPSLPMPGRVHRHRRRACRHRPRPSLQPGVRALGANCRALSPAGCCSRGCSAQRRPPPPPPASAPSQRSGGTWWGYTVWPTIHRRTPVRQPYPVFPWPASLAPALLRRAPCGTSTMACRRRPSGACPQAQSDVHQLSTSLRTSLLVSSVPLAVVGT